MKKFIAFALAFVITFSSIGFVDGYAAARISAEVQALVDIGMLVGDGDGVTEKYTQKEMDRFTAGISILKLRGLYEEALRYRGSDNFTDKDEVKWSEGRNILAYLKANPHLGFIGDERGRFRPYEKINEQSYFKVLLETLGYKQIVSGKGDFTWDDTLKFASSIGLKPSRENKFTIDLLAKATVSALRTKTKDGLRYVNVLIGQGVIKKSRALSAGLISDMIDVDVKSVKAVGNTVVEIVFKENVDSYDVEELDNYDIDGLSVKDAYLVRKDAVRVETSAQTSGKLYSMTVANQKVKFTGVAKVSGAPNIKNVKSEDVETVVIEFDKELDFDSATSTSNYSISGVYVKEAVLEGRKVTLSTDGLQAKKSYTVKVSNIKSIDGVALRSASKNFYAKIDTNPPTLKNVKAETNRRVVITFSEAVTRSSAEDLRNYYIKSGSGELEILDAVLTGDDEDTVELTTEPMKTGVKYELTVENIVDKTKAANMMKRPAKKTFYGVKEDKNAPVMSKSDLKVLSRNHIQVVFTDNSRIMEDTVLNPDNYEITKNDRNKDRLNVESVEKISYKDGKYKVMLKVEDLTIGSSYTVKAYNIEDEFGNVLEKNNSATVTVARDDFAAATVYKYNVVSGNKLEIYFTKPLDEKSAEDISNYEISNDIGKPIEATYENEKVTLEMAQMIEGKKYKVTIDGVLDMMGNKLKLNFEYKATAGGEEDNDGPMLEYIYAVNKYVVAAVFDEPVSYTENSTVLVLKSGGKTMKLYAKALTNDDRTIEFSNIKEGKKLSDGVLYTVDKNESLKGIKDRTVNKNPFDRKDLNDYDLEIYGIDEDPEKPEILNISQRDGKTFEIEFSKEVMVEKKEASTVGSPSATFSVKTDDEDRRFVTFTITSSKAIDGTKDYKVDIEKIVTDKHGIGAENTYGNYTLLYGEYKDEDKPYILTVTAVDRVTVEIEYNESIGYEGKYTIKNTDDTAKYKTIGNTLKKIDKNKVILSLSQPLEGRYEYVLIVDTPAKDLVGNTSENTKGDEFYFMGTDLAPVKLPAIEEQENKTAAQKVMAKISDLPKDIRLSDKEKVYAALAAYNDLTANGKKYVDNYDKLKKAIDAIDKLEQEAKDKIKAAEVEKLIENLLKVENIKLEDANKIKAVREAYDALTKSQRDLVSNIRKLLLLEDRIKELKEKHEQTEEDKKKAANVEKAINDLPKVENIKLTDKESVKNAREAYEKLSSTQKKLVTNLDKLKKAENRINELEKEREQTEEDKRKAARVEELINDLPKVQDIRLIDKDEVEDARKAYEKLSSTQKQLVTNLDKLVKAENRINELEKEKAQTDEDKKKAARVEDMINELPDAERIKLSHKDEVEAARSAYNNLSSDQQALITNINKLVSAEKKLVELEAKRDEEEKADKVAREAAEKAVAAFELVSSREEWNNKISALSKAIDTLKASIEGYLNDTETTPSKGAIEIFGRWFGQKSSDAKETDNSAKLEEAYAAFNKALEEAEAFMQKVKEAETKAVEAYENLKDGDFKTGMAGIIRDAKAKADDAGEKIKDLKANIPKLQDVLDVKTAKTWLTADKFTFDPNNPQSSESPIIYAAANHHNQTVYDYSVVENKAGGRSIRSFGGGNMTPGSVIIQDRKAAFGLGGESKNSDNRLILKIVRGTEDTTVTLKVEISKGSVVTYKLFKINIPKLSDEMLPITVE